MPNHITGVFALIVVSKGQLWIKSIHFFVHLWGQIKCKNIILEKFLVDHVIKHWSNSFLSEIWVGKSNNSIKIFSEDAIFFFNVTKLLSLYDELRARLAKFTSTNSEIINVKMTTKTTGAKWNISFLGSHDCCARLLFVIR